MFSRKWLTVTNVMVWYNLRGGHNGNYTITAIDANGVAYVADLRGSYPNFGEKIHASVGLFGKWKRRD
jgi:hypothetical protein